MPNRKKVPKFSRHIKSLITFCIQAKFLLSRSWFSKPVKYLTLHQWRNRQFIINSEVEFICISRWDKYAAAPKRNLPSCEQRNNINKNSYNSFDPKQYSGHIPTHLLFFLMWVLVTISCFQKVKTKLFGSHFIKAHSLNTI